MTMETSGLPGSRQTRLKALPCTLNVSDAPLPAAYVKCVASSTIVAVVGAPFREVAWTSQVPARVVGVAVAVLQVDAKDPSGDGGWTPDPPPSFEPPPSPEAAAPALPEPLLQADVVIPTSAAIGASSCTDNFFALLFMIHFPRRPLAAMRGDVYAGRVCEPVLSTVDAPNRAVVLGDYSVGPVSCTGTGLLVIVPFRSSPYALSPQHSTEPRVVTTQVDTYPAAAAQPPIPAMCAASRSPGLPSGASPR